MYHMQADHPRSDACREGRCAICDGGLFSCALCLGAEGSLPSHCPCRAMTEQEQVEVMDGQLNFRLGRWRPESNRSHRTLIFHQRRAS
jgi:hypothetical protein